VLLGGAAYDRAVAGKLLVDSPLKKPLFGRERVQPALAACG
jgi:hypothetical protein